MQIAWRPQMAVDHGLIDRDHWTLLQIISEFSSIEGELPGAQVLAEILQKLDRYTQVHFEREQWLQKTIRYPFAEAHEHEHRDLIRRLDAMRAKFKPEASREEIVAIHREVSALLNSWLLDHILQSDLRMRPFAAAIRKGTTGFADLASAAG